MQRLSGLAARSKPFLAYRMDMGKLISTVIPAMEQSMGLPSTGIGMFEGTSLPLNFYVGLEERSWTSGMMVDLVQVGDFVAMVERLSEM